MVGGAVLAAADKLIPHLHLCLPEARGEGIRVTWHRNILLILVIMLDNFPEGLEVGVAFGAAAAGLPSAAWAAAIALAIRISA